MERLTKGSGIKYIVSIKRFKHTGNGTGGAPMHKNLVVIQQKIVENSRESLKILEVEDQGLMILPALAVAERPLSEQEIIDRTGASAGEIRKRLEYFVGRSLVVKAKEAVYELNPEMEKIMARIVQEKIVALRKNTQEHMAECERLLNSARAEYDDYDILMSKYLRDRIAKMKLVVAILTRRNSLLRLLDSAGEGNSEITKISIE
jgi:hypothetical protein